VSGHPGLRKFTTQNWNRPCAPRPRVCPVPSYLRLASGLTRSMKCQGDKAVTATGQSSNAQIHRNGVTVKL